MILAKLESKKISGVQLRCLILLAFTQCWISSRLSTKETKDWFKKVSKTKGACVIPKLFPYDEESWVMKLTKGKLLETLRKKNDGWTTYQVRKIAGISIRRVNQVWQEYQQSGELPEIGRRVGRPAYPIQDWEVNLVKKTYLEYRVSAVQLEVLIKLDTGKHIPHNRIHKILLSQGWAKQVGPVIRKKTWIRYERRHSLTAVHMDWHQRPNDGFWVCPVLDDASRFIPAATECNSPTVDATIEVLEQALQHGSIKQVITDHGSQFTSNIGGQSRFATFLDEHNIQHILCRIKHPQSNGKVEKWFHLYERHRDAFESLPALLHWYNDIRPHMSLDFENLETPAQAFKRKMRTT